MTDRKNLSSSELSDLANKIRSVGGVEPKPSLSSHFEIGRMTLVNLHEHVLDGKISKEDAMAGHPEYRPDKVIGTYKNGQKKYQRYVLDESVRQRRNKVGSYKNYKGGKYGGR